MLDKEGYVRICVWADGTWCNIDDVEEYTYMSDDYAIVRVPEELIYDDAFEEDLQNVINETISYKVD